MSRCQTIHLATHGTNLDVTPTYYQRRFDTQVLSHCVVNKYKYFHRGDAWIELEEILHGPPVEWTDTQPQSLIEIPFEIPVSNSLGRIILIQ